jgi:ABC-type proline/glycine betaine transport system permease subunit
MLQVIIHFMPVLLAGFMVNLEIGVATVMIAVALGVPLALLRRRVALLRRPVRSTIGLMQALPTYVVMFFVLTLLPRDLTILNVSITGMTAVVLAQSVYLTAYVSEDAHEALGHWQRHDREQALLFLPNLLRGFVVVVMSSGFGAAVGVSEAVSATMRQAERLPDAGDRILLFAVAIAFFAVIVGSLNALIRLAISRLRHHVPVHQ